MKFNTYRLSEVITLEDARREPLSAEQRAARKGIYPYYGAQGVVDYLDDYTFVGDKLLVAEDGENLRSNKQPIANWATGKFRVNNHAHVLCGSPFCNLRYLCYLLNEMNLSAYITGSTQPKLSQKSLLNIEISLPSRNLQDKIVSFIQPIDNKVTCLTRTNGHLLELIKTEFARRFENEDTATCGLGEVANIWNKTVKPMNVPGTLWEHYSIPAFDAEQYPSYELGDTIKSNKYEVVSNSILVSKLNPSTRRLWIPQLIDEKSAICSTEFMEYVPNNPKEYSFYCSALLQDRFFSYLAGHVTGSTGSRQRVHPSDTLAYEVPNPDASEILNYCNYADPLIKQLRNSSIERQKLTQLRAVLLPKLMSGEIDASKVELPTPPTQTAPTNGRLSE